METEESIEIADLHVRFNAYGSTIDAEGEEEEEIVEDEEVDDRSVQPFDVDFNFRGTPCFFNFKVLNLCCSLMI